MNTDKKFTATSMFICGLWFNRSMESIHLDEHILVVDKPAGLSVLPDGWEPEAPYLVKLLEKKYGKIWIVHRLDKVTSGVMVFARSAEAHRALNRQFEQHEVEKIYHAFVEGDPAWAQKDCKMPLRTNVGHKHRTAVDDKRGKSAETYFKVLKRFQAGALLEARPLTGRTHQIRAHLFALGYPLLGDVLYGAQKTELIERPALHARALTFSHPQSGERVTFRVPYPEDMEKLQERLNV